MVVPAIPVRYAREDIGRLDFHHTLRDYTTSDRHYKTPTPTVKGEERMGLVSPERRKARSEIYHLLQLATAIAISPQLVDFYDEYTPTQLDGDLCWFVPFSLCMRWMCLRKLV